MSLQDSVGFLGSPGSYSHQAASRLRPNSEPVGFETFDKLISAVEQGDVEEAVLPLENSTSGRIPDIHRLVVSMELYIIEELLLDVNHCLVSSEVVELNTVEAILSHPQGFVQSAEFLKRNLSKASKRQRSDTATAVKEAVNGRDGKIVAIGSEFAANYYNGVVLNRNISDRDDNITRFALLSREAKTSDSNDVTSMILQVDHRPGSLVRALSVFGKHDVNITKLETYMISDKTVLPTFYLDIGCGSHDEKLVMALKELKGSITYSKFLGSYKSDEKRNGRNGFLKP